MKKEVSIAAKSQNSTKLSPLRSLNTFCDALKSAYNTTAYLKLEFE